MAKQLVFGEGARSALKRGMDSMAQAVVTTLGPKGRNVALDKKWGAPTVTHDGVTVAKEIDLRDPFENMGAQLLEEAAAKTNEIAGDGTTTATLLAYAIVLEGMKNVAAGANPMLLKRGVLAGAEAVTAAITAQAIEVNDRASIASVATISAQDREIGELIAEVMDKVGRDGVITVEESKGLKFETEYVEGMRFDRGYISPYFVTDPERVEAVVEDAFLLIHEKKISSARDLVPILERIIQSGRRNLAIIAEDVAGEALATLVLNSLRGVFGCLAVKAPGYGDRRKAMLHDIAVLTGATVINEEQGRKLEGVRIEDLGRATKVIANKDETTIIGGQADAAAIQARIAQIKVEIEQATSDYDREKLQERLASLAGGVAVIRVGAATETELKEKKHRVEDALSATRAAVEEGIVPGGGIALINAIPALEGVRMSLPEEQTGVNVLRRALEMPLCKIVENAGQHGPVILETVRRMHKEQGNERIGYDVMRGSFVDMVDAGIIDPVKVTKGALQNAASVAAMVLSTEALITDKPERQGAVRRGGNYGAMPDYEDGDF